LFLIANCFSDVAKVSELVFSQTTVKDVEKITRGSFVAQSFYQRDNATCTLGVCDVTEQLAPSEPISSTTY